MKRRLAALACACAGCAMPAEPVPVVAQAQLMPLAEDITGPIQVLDANSAYAQIDDFALHTLAAFQVRLPDPAPRRVLIYDAGSCEAPLPERTQVIADLQTIRKVGNETHFFAQDILVQGRRLDLDTGTTQAEFSLDSSDFFGVLGKIAVVHAPDAMEPPSTLLACGVFALTRRMAADRPPSER